jgi:hypothetical protein
MGQLINVLAIDYPDWTIPWAGIGGFLLGVGGTLSGIAAVMTARRKGRDETISAAVPRSDDDSGSGISDSDSVEPRSSGTSENSDD